MKIKIAVIVMCLLMTGTLFAKGNNEKYGLYKKEIHAKFDKHYKKHHKEYHKKHHQKHRHWKGEDGQDGQNGMDGLDGINGIDGTNGINGIDGAQGPAGATTNVDLANENSETKIVGELELRLYDGRKIAVESFYKYDLRHSRGHEIGMRLGIKLVSSYEERQINDLKKVVETLKTMAHDPGCLKIHKWE